MKGNVMCKSAIVSHIEFYKKIMKNVMYQLMLLLYRY